MEINNKMTTIIKKKDNKILSIKLIQKPFSSFPIFIQNYKYANY